LEHPTVKPSYPPSWMSPSWFCQRCIKRLQFTSVQEVKESVHAWLANQTTDFFLGVYSSLSTVGLSISKNRGDIWKMVLSHIFCCC
jgi:hypothetical protein